MTLWKWHGWRKTYRFRIGYYWSPEGMGHTYRVFSLGWYEFCWSSYD